MVRLICVPHGLGAEVPGMTEGPATLLEALAARTPARPPVEWVAIPRSGGVGEPYVRAHHLDRIRVINTRLAAHVAVAVAAGDLPIVLGGDHTVAIGTWAGLHRALPGAKLGVLWIDAHPDLNTPETTPSHHAHGMPLAAITGRGHPLLTEPVNLAARVPLTRVALVGIRAIDPGEAAFLAEHPDLLALPAAAIHARGREWMLSQLQGWLARLDGVYLSFDLDALDPKWAPGVTTPAAGGLAPEDVRSIVSLVGRHSRLAAAEVVEYLPRRDRGGVTADLAAELIVQMAGIRRSGDRLVGSRVASSE